MTKATRATLFLRTRPIVATYVPDWALSVGPRQVRNGPGRPQGFGQQGFRGCPLPSCQDPDSCATRRCLPASALRLQKEGGSLPQYAQSAQRLHSRCAQRRQKRMPARTGAPATVLGAQSCSIRCGAGPAAPGRCVARAPHQRAHVCANGQQPRHSALRGCRQRERIMQAPLSRRPGARYCFRPGGLGE